jgi:hypothetical protein
MNISLTHFFEICFNIIDTCQTLTHPVNFHALDHEVTFWKVLNGPDKAKPQSDIRILVSIDRKYKLIRVTLINERRRYV